MNIPYSALSTFLSKIQLFPFSEGCVLFDCDSSKISVLNHSAAFMLDELKNGSNFQEIVGKVAASFGIPLSIAQKDTKYFIENLIYESAGSAHGRASVVVQPSINSSQVPGAFTASRQWASRHLFALPSNCSLELLSVHAGFSSEYSAIMHNFLTEGGLFGQKNCLAVVKSENGFDGYDIILNNIFIYNAVAGNDVVIHLLYCTFNLVVDHFDDAILFHSSVVERFSKAIIFPGEAGSGKTTLAAILCGKGYGLVSDELAIVDRSSGAIRACPLPMSIKSGSLSLIGQYYPDIFKQKSYVRSDGKEVRWAVPQRERLYDEKQPAKPYALIFPEYNHAIDEQIHTISKSEALYRLARLYSSSRDLDNRDVAIMIDMVENCFCFRVVYSDVQVVEQLIDEILQSGL